MTNSVKYVHDVAADTITVSELTAEEKAEFDKNVAEFATIQTAQQEAEAQKSAAKAALLEKLGITEDEAKLLLS
jgi:hypothetical protein